MSALKLHPRDQLNGREAAYVAVLDAFTGRGFVAEKLHSLRREGTIDRREAALALEIGLGALRHAITIGHVLAAVAEYDRRRVNPPLKTALCTAAYQIIWMDRIPVHAAVDEAVALARRHAGRPGGGMVNAVLRKLSGAIAARRVEWRRLDRSQVRVSWHQACAFRADVLPAPGESDGHVAHFAAATGERAERYRTLVERHGPERAEQIAWASQAVPSTVLQRNVLRINPAVFQERVREQFGTQAEWTADAAFLPAATNFVDTPLFRSGLAYVQDDTARAAALLLKARLGERMLDLCAAPGGKSIVLAQDMQDRGEVIACDASAERLRRVRDNLSRMRLTCVRTHLIHTSDVSDRDLSGHFDAAMVDVPCSNTGVIARRPEARLGLTRQKLESLVKLQAALLARAAASVRPGGRLVYSTCSIEPEENEQIVQAFLAENPPWQLDGSHLAFPTWGPKLSDWRDGGYAARLARAS